MLLDATTALALVVGISLENQLGRHGVKAVSGVYRAAQAEMGKPLVPLGRPGEVKRLWGW
jgi:hypothetical protein